MRAAGIKRIVVFLGLSLGILAGFAARIDIASAQNSSNGAELISRASKSYQAGAYADASELIDTAFKAGLSGEMASRAILLRAQINERSGALARALQDYSNALWMDSLPASERKKAKEGKERVIAAMGLNSSPSPSATPRQASAPTAGSSPSVSAAAASESSSSGIFGVFGGLFGSSKPEAPPPPQPQQSWQTATDASAAAAAPSPQKPAAPAPVKPAPKVERTAKAAPKPVPAPVQRATLQPASASSVVSSADGYLIVFGAANTEASGRSTAQYIKAQLSDILINRQLDVMAMPGGGFQVQAGPYKAKSAALALCSAMKQRGVPCQVTP